MLNGNIWADNGLNLSGKIFVRKFRSASLKSIYYHNFFQYQRFKLIFSRRVGQTLWVHSNGKMLFLIKINLNIFLTTLKTNKCQWVCTSPKKQKTKKSTVLSYEKQNSLWVIKVNFHSELQAAFSFERKLYLSWSAKTIPANQIQKPDKDYTW